LGPCSARRSLALLALGLALGNCAPASAPPEPAAPRLTVEDEIRRLVAAGGAGLGLADTVGIAASWSRVSRLYQERHHRACWSRGSRPKLEADRLLEAIRGLSEAGLDPADYGAEHLGRLLAQARRPDSIASVWRPRTLARFDVIATYGYVRAAEHLRHGRVPRDSLDRDWAVDTLDFRRLERSLGRDPARLYAELEPGHEGYRRLREALARYRAVAAAGGWPALPPGPALKLGARGPRVAALVRRLVASGDYRASARDTVFSPRLASAVGNLQARLGIPVSGVVGEATSAALDVPVERRIRQIELNLERWRWLPDSLGRRRVEVNIPAYRLELFHGGRVTRAMRVVVGKRRSPTPVFSDRITYLEINPTWTLPPSVVAKEIVPALKKNRDYLEENQMHVVSIASSARDTVESRDVPWKLAETDSFPYLVVQAAGPENPLGSIKLMCPNEYDVYLHDTPVRSRFSVAVRDYSHGCVRVEHAHELADSLLARAPDDTLMLDSLVTSGEWRRLHLPVATPVHFLYWTAWADSAGRMYFREDLYGLDQRLDEALRNRRTRELVVNAGVEMNPLWLAEERASREKAAKLERQRAAKAAAGKAAATKAAVGKRGGSP
jgi:murein L,D-transpeptidase YcbB/YkuD